MTVAALDIGGTKTSVAVVAEGEILHLETFPTIEFAETIGQAIAYLKSTGEILSGIGIGCTGPLDDSLGIVLNGDTLTGWAGENVKEPFLHAFDVPVFLMNDASAALLGEVSCGSLEPFKDKPVVMLTFGTGVGGAFWDGMDVVSGAYGEHQEIGHIVVESNGPDCYCGASGCLESLASGPAIRSVANNLGHPKIEDLLEAAKQGNPDAVQAVSGVKMAIYRGAWNICHTFRPAAIAFGGGIMEAFYDELKPNEAEFNEAATLLGVDVRFVAASLGNQAGVVGASVAAELGAS